MKKALLLILFLFLCTPKIAFAQTNMINMDQDTEKIYQLLKTECGKIAKGEKNSVITINTSQFFDKETYTYEELGIDVASQNIGALNSRAKEIIRNKLRVKIEAALDRMKIDCPYELYWFDRTSNISLTFTYVRNSVAVFFEDADNVSITLSVAKDYQKDGISIKLDPEAVKRAEASRKTALSIVNKYADCSDREKIIGYAKEIKNLTSYDEEAITSTYLSKYGYGDPYQLLSVFDQDPSTKTVCEGYAKAFQYLCNLSTFAEAKSYIVTGTLASNNTNGTHMWNNVRMNGQNYIVDVTNATFPDNTLVLSGAVEVDGKYLTLNNTKQKMYFSYDEETTSLYKPELLSLAHAHIADEPVMENFVAATCTTPKTYDTVTYCHYCQEELSRDHFEGTVGEHDYKVTTVKKSCTSGGYKLHECQKCGYSYKNSATPSYGGHSWNSGTTNADTTITYTCLRCAETKTEGTPQAPATPSVSAASVPPTVVEPTPAATPVVPETPVTNQVVNIQIIGKTSVKPGKSLTVKAAVKTTTGQAVGVTWSVNNKKYAKVSPNGKVTALKAGKGKKIIVTATAADGSGKKASKAIVIKKK